MKRLHLLRHAHTLSGDPSKADHTRALSERGHEECARLAQWWKKEGPSVDMVLCSDAVRAVQTYESLKSDLSRLPEAVYQPKLYLASPAEIVNVLKNAAGEAKNVLLVGHNPGLHELGLTLDTGHSEAIERLELGLPTAGLMSFETGVSQWKELQMGAAKLVTFKTV